MTRMTPMRGAELLLEFLDGSLDVDLAQELQQYINENPEFRAFADSYRATVALVQKTMKQEVPKDTEERALNFLRSNNTSTKVS